MSVLKSSSIDEMIAKHVFRVAIKVLMFSPYRFFKFCHYLVKKFFLILCDWFYLPQESFNPTAKLNTGFSAAWSTRSATKYPCRSN